MPQVAILDDYLHNAMDCADWSRLPSAVGVRVFDRPFADQTQAAQQLAGFEAIVAMRERTRLEAGLLAALSGLRLIITTGMRQQFSWEASANAYIKLYQAAIEARRSIERNF